MNRHTYYSFEGVGGQRCNGGVRKEGGGGGR